MSYKIEKSKYAFCCTSSEYCYQDDIEEANKIFDKFVNSCKVKSKDATKTKFTISIFEDGDENKVIKQVVIEPQPEVKK